MSTAPSTDLQPAMPRSLAKRRAILHAAREAFLRHGFERASMDLVADTAGVSKMTVYRHFGSKEELFAGVITQLCDRIVGEELEDALEQNPPQALRAFAEKMVAIIFAPETVELHRIVIAESRRFPKLGAYFYAHGPQVCIDVLAAYFSRNRGDRRLDVGDPKRAAEEFLELLRGYAHLRLLLGMERRPGRADLDARIETALAHVLA